MRTAGYMIGAQGMGTGVPFAAANNFWPDESDKKRNNTDEMRR